MSRNIFSQFNLRDIPRSKPYLIKICIVRRKEGIREQTFLSFLLEIFVDEKRKW